MKKALLFAWFSAFLLLLAGCLYPQEKRVEHQLPVPERVQWVQEAVDAYREKTGVLPIQTREAETPIYEKYPIDFGRLVPKYLPYIPGDAFEQGGSHLYVLVDPENHPKVRLLDIQTAQIVADVQKATDLYWIKNHRLPATEVRYFPQFFNVEFKKLGMQEILIKSPFTGHYLPLIMDQVGHIGVDYAQDIAMFLKKTDPERWKDRDLRELLVEQSLYVPVKSFPYRLIDGKPTPQLLSSQKTSPEKSGEKR